MTKKKDDRTPLEKLRDNKVTALKKFINASFEGSNYVNEEFYTNRHIMVVDSDFEVWPKDKRVLDAKKPHCKTDIDTVEIIGKFQDRKYCIKMFKMSEFKKFVADIKKVTIDQLRITPNGEFEFYDEYGHKKWEASGRADVFKDINLEFSTALFHNILNYFKSATKCQEITIKSDVDHLLIEGRGVKIYAIGVELSEGKMERQHNDTPRLFPGEKPN